MTTTFEWNDQILQQLNLDREETTVTIDQQELEYEDYFLALTPRAGLYGQFQVLDFLSLDFGFSAQYIQYQPSNFSNKCTYEKTLTDVDEALDPEVLASFASGGDCSPENLYPSTPYHSTPYPSTA